jgi:segregation and condensation protein B
MSMELDAKIEAILFYKSEPVKLSELVGVLGESEFAVRSALDMLRENLSSRGLSLVEYDNTVELRTAPSASTFIDEMRKEELSRDIGKAGAETLAIVLYKGTVTRADVDYIRGVNSTFILRNLMIRGLVEREQNPKDARTYLYKPTIELLSYLGVSSLRELPRYGEVQTELGQFMEERENTNKDLHNE